MTFITWVKYSGFMFCVGIKMDGKFCCEKYKGSSKVFGEVLEFPNSEELLAFLLSFPNPPVEDIEKLIDLIGKKYHGENQ